MKQENVMTQTSLSIEPNSGSMATNDDDPDLLEVLSLCEGTTNEFDLNEDDIEFDDDIMSEQNAISGIESDYSGTQTRTPNGINRFNLSTKSLRDSKTIKSEGESDGNSRSSRRPFGLQLAHESDRNNLELPSPSSASLHSGCVNIVMQELSTKSNSAPILLKKERIRPDYFVGQSNVNILIIDSLPMHNFSLIFSFICRVYDTQDHRATDILQVRFYHSIPLVIFYHTLGSVLECYSC